MIKLNKIHLFLMFFGISFISYSQDWDIGVSVAQSSDNKYTKSLPATFIATFPSEDDKDDSYSINGFISIDIYKGDKDFSNFKTSIIFEQHKNTLISKKQDVYQYGVKFEGLFSFGKDKIYPNLYVFPEFSFKHSIDRENNKKGLQYLGYISFGKPTPFKTEFLDLFRSGVMHPADRRNNFDTKDLTLEEIEELKIEKKKIDWTNMYVSDWIQFKHAHSIGIEHVSYEKLTMANFGFNFEAYPLSGILYSVFNQYGILQFRYAIDYRSELSSSNSDLYVGSLVTTGIAINYKFDKDGKTAVSFGYEHQNGGNPLKGLADTKFGQFKISTIIKI